MTKLKQAEEFLQDCLRIIYKTNPKDVVNEVLEDIITKETTDNLIKEIAEWKVIPNAEEYLEGI